MEPSPLLPFDVILFDIGGVLLTNGLDHNDRAHLFERFAIDPEEYNHRQQDWYDRWDTGQITADQFLSHTVFHRKRPFSRAEYWAAVLERSQLLDDGALGILQQISASNRYRVGALNNEPRETNEYRFARFGLGQWLRLRFSSCYMGLHKPDLAFYRRAVDILGVTPDRILFIDDRPVNVEAAARVGIHALCFEGRQQLSRQLETLGVLVER